MDEAVWDEALSKRTIAQSLLEIVVIIRIITWGSSASDLPSRIPTIYTSTGITLQVDQQVLTNLAN